MVFVTLNLSELKKNELRIGLRYIRYAACITKYAIRVKGKATAQICAFSILRLSRMFVSLIISYF